MYVVFSIVLVIKFIFITLFNNFNQVLMRVLP